MTNVSVPRICVVGESRGVGKSLLVAGVLLALQKRGLSVSCAILGNALQQAVVYSHIVRRYVRCLDAEMLGYQGVLDAIGQISSGSDIVVIDGTGGIFDGRFDDPSEPATDQLCIQRAEFPSVLVLNVDHITPSILARVYGFVSFPGGPSFDSLIFNRLKELPDSATKQRFQQLMFETGAPDTLGYVPALELCGELPRSFDCQGSNRGAVPMQFLKDISVAVEEHIDLDELIAFAATAETFEFNPVHPLVKRGLARLAVAHDSCFGVGFQDNLDLLRLSGVEIVTFSPLADGKLPSAIGGIYIPGGCISEYAAVLEKNKDLATAIKAFVEEGGVLFSEGAGTALLSRTFYPESAQRAYNGFGLLPIHVVEDLQSISQARMSIAQDCILGVAGMECNALVPSDWKVAPASLSEFDGERVLRWTNSAGHSIAEGFSMTAQSCSTLNFIHFGSNPSILEALVSAISAHQASLQRRTGAADCRT